jgi:hypothetical protein
LSDPVLEYRLTVEDLAQTRLAYSPVHETVLSLRVHRRPDIHAEHLPWLARTRAAFAELDSDFLLSLISPDRRIPDYLTPRPRSPLHSPSSIDEEFAGLREVPVGTVLEHLRQAYEQQEVPQALRQALHRPAVLPARIADALHAYWTACLKPYWTKIASVLEADIAYRARRLASGGAQALFEDLDHRVAWADGRLLIQRGRGTPAQHARADEGLALLPSLFMRGAVTMIDPAIPVIAYPARGRGAVWDRTDAPAAEGVAVLIGAPRTRLLALLQTPASTTELAKLLGVTAGAVSQHLCAMHAAGLLNRTRQGRSVLYMRSSLGDALMREA